MVGGALDAAVRVAGEGDTMKRKPIPRWRRGLKREVWARVQDKRAMTQFEIAMMVAVMAQRARLGLPV